jgi:hypothetical protein
MKISIESVKKLTEESIVTLHTKQIGPSGNVADLYSGGVPFDYLPRHRQS